jgi:hypothetical protein
VLIAAAVGLASLAVNATLPRNPSGAAVGAAAAR